MPLRIAHIVPRLDEGGVERCVLELCEGMAGRGHESVVLSLGGRLEGMLAQRGARLERIDVAGKNPFTLLPRALEMRRRLRAIGPDIVHVHSRIPAWMAKLARVRREFPLASTVHGFNRVGAYSRAMTDADAVTAPSRALREHLLASYGLAPDRVRIVPWGIDPAHMAAIPRVPDSHSAVRSHCPGEGCFLAASVGRLSSRKGHDLFVRALAKARGREPALCGVVVGGSGRGGGYRERLEEIARQARLGERIRFLDAVEDVRSLYAAIDLLVAASPKPEGFGRVALEAIAAGRPVVAARCGGLLDVVEDGRNGLLFEPGDEDDLAAKIVEASRRKWADLPASVARFRAGSTLDGMEDVYLRCAAGRREGGM